MCFCLLPPIGMQTVVLANPLLLFSPWTNACCLCRVCKHAWWLCYQGTLVFSCLCSVRNISNHHFICLLAISLLLILFLAGSLYWFRVMEYFRWFRPAAESFLKVPFFGAISYLTLAVSPVCIVFAVLWAVYRQYTYAWIGQDILVSATICSITCLSL